MKLLTTLFLLLITTSITHAEEGIIKKPLEYDVEVIIFEDANARYINSEDWTQDDIFASPDAETKEPPKNLNKLSISEINATIFTSIKPEILNQEYKRISHSKEYNVLFYGSWRQTGLDAKKAFEINIQELKNTHRTTSENTLAGNFKLVLARYLHFYSKLDYQRKSTDTATEQPVTNQDTTESLSEITTPENETYPINIHRRMRSKELHYIDHPLVGILIQINPVKPSTEETAETSAVL